VSLKAVIIETIYPLTIFTSIQTHPRIRAGQPEGITEFGRLQKDTKTDDLMMEDLGKYVIKNITGRTYWK
jgi:hypothetical protein